MANESNPMTIEELYVPTKASGDTLSAVEFNKVPSKINEIITYLRGLDEHTRQLIAAAITPMNNIRLMTTAEYLAQGSWDARVFYICVDDGELTSVNIGMWTIASRSSEALMKGFPYSLPIAL